MAIKQSIDPTLGIQYVSSAKKEVPYLYVNLKTYNPDNDSTIVFYDYGYEKCIIGVYLMYYDCLHFYTRNQGYPLDHLVSMIEKHNPKVIMLQDNIGIKMLDNLSGKYYNERNHIIDMDEIPQNVAQQYKSVLAKEEDIPKIVNLLMTEEEYTSVYDKDILLAQMMNRFQNSISRYYVVKENDSVVATCSTYGETSDFALVGGVIVHRNSRRRGYAQDIENHICEELKRDGKSKVGFVNHENYPSLELHTKLGAIIGATYSKFIRKI